jgi:hypothetical protein
MHKSKKRRDNMEKRILLSVVVAGLLILGSMGTCLAGVEPSPFQPELNKLHSIGLSMAIIQKGFDNLVISPSLPRGTKSALLAIRYDLYLLDTQLADVLPELPPYDEQDVGQKGVFFALEGIRMNALGMEDPLDYILWRMGIEPSPWKEILDSITSRINGYVTPCPVGTPCPGF